MKTDAESIQDLLFLYAERLDAGDLAGVAALFEDATLRTQGGGDGHFGSDAVFQLYASKVRLYDGVPCTKHVTSNVIVDIAENSATARSYFTVFQARPELPLQAIIAGRYHDAFVRGAAGWRFRERVILIDLLGDLRFHLG